MSLRSRLAALERRSQAGEMTIIRIIGGMPDPKLEEATAGSQRWTQRADESEAAFRIRATAQAKGTGAKFLVFGGLPSCAHSDCNI